MAFTADLNRAEKVIDEVREAVANWREYADAAGVPDASAAAIEEMLLLM